MRPVKGWSGADIRPYFAMFLLSFQHKIMTTGDGNPGSESQVFLEDVQ
jgi:hypothetical protein